MHLTSTPNTLQTELVTLAAAATVSSRGMAPLSREFGRLRAKLNKTEPTTLAGAVVKLRQLADPAEGIEQGPMKGDLKSLRQVLAFLEGEVASHPKPAISEPERVKLRARAEALAIELAAPLPEGDAGLVEAERRLRENEAREKEIYRDFREFPDHVEIEAFSMNFVEHGFFVRFPSRYDAFSD